MTIEEAVSIAKMEIDILRGYGVDPQPYDILRVCDHLMNAIELIAEKLPKEE